MRPSPPRRRRFVHLLLIASVIVSIWMLVALYNAAEFYRSALARGGPADWNHTLHFNIVMGLNWALWTPLIMAIAERLPLDPAHRLRSLRSLALLTMLIPLLALARAAWGGALLKIAEGDWPTLAFVKLSIGIRLHSYTVMISLIVAVTYLIDMYRDYRAREQSSLTLQAAVANAEAEHLRSELQPTLVFGTLVAIRNRVRSDPETADRMIVRLAEMLRRGLDRRGSDSSIEDELDHTDRYVELQRFRFGTDIATRSLIDDDVLTARVPALALQTLIDAAISSSPPSVIELRGSTLGNALHLEARVQPSRIASLEGRGARLRDWFGPDCQTHLSAENDSVVAAVEIPLEYVA